MRCFCANIAQFWWIAFLLIGLSCKTLDEEPGGQVINIEGDQVWRIQTWATLDGVNDWINEGQIPGRTNPKWSRTDPRWGENKQVKPYLNINWQKEFIPPGIQADHFSTRYHAYFTFKPGTYKISYGSDGKYSVRSGNHLRENFLSSDVPPAAGSRVIRLTAEERVLVEVGVQKHSSSTRMFFSVENVDGSSGPTDWSASYFADMELANPVFSENLGPKNTIFKQWGGWVPEGLPKDEFSARFSRQLIEGDYHLNIDADDGVRVRLDGKVIADRWQNGQNSVAVNFSAVDGAILEVEYYEFNGGSTIHLELSSVD